MPKMSGVVVKLNDDDEEEEEEEDDTVLLSTNRRGRGSRRRQDSDDEDEEDFRLASSRGKGRSVLKKLRGPKISSPYASVRGGTFVQVLNTLTICCIFFGMVSDFALT